MSVPLVSVVVPLYNKAPYIERCARSVLVQTAGDFELVVVDDGSTDGGGAIVEALADSRIVLLRQENRGRSAARNRGIAAARAALIAFLDADDEMGPAYLEAMLGLRRRFPQAGLYATGYRKSFHGHFTVQVSVQPDGRTQPMLIDNYFDYAPQYIVCSSNVALPRTVLDEFGGFAVQESWGEDTDLWGRVALRYPLAYDPAFYNTYHCEACGRTPRLPPKTVFPFIRSATMALRAGNIPQSRVESVKEYVNFLWLHLCYQIIDSGIRSEALRILREELPDSRMYARTVRFVGGLMHAVPLSTASLVLRLLRSRHARFFSRSGLRLPGLTPN
jgi:glycosyltransferase involved in cell wall biosynthesis